MCSERVTTTWSARRSAATRRRRADQRDRHRPWRRAWPRASITLPESPDVDSAISASAVRIGDHLPREVASTPMSFAIAVRIEVSWSGRRRCAQRRRRERKSATRPSRRSPSRRCQAPAAGRRSPSAPHRLRRRRRRPTFSVSVWLRNAPTSADFISAERRTLARTDSLALALARYGYRKLDAPAS